MKIEDAITLAINNVKKEGLTDILISPKPFEINLLDNPGFVTLLHREIKSRIKSDDFEKLKVQPINYILLPKKEAFDFRKGALIDPLDSILSLALVLIIADKIEASRPKLSDNIVFSYRFKPSEGYLFNPSCTYKTFTEYINSNSGNSKILMKCDIANFYDRLNLHRLESTLHSLGISEPKAVKLINMLHLFWANRDSYGLPVGGNASRILAEAALISVDDYLISHKIKFCRFVDDYCFFAPDIESAHKWLMLFVERLYLEGLSVNPAKTMFKNITENTHTLFEHSTKPLKTDFSKFARLITGYSGTIPTKFRELSDKDKLNFQNKDLDAQLEDALSRDILIPNDIKNTIKILVAQNRLDKFDIFKKIIDRFPQFTPMIVDLLSKKQKEIPEKIKATLLAYFIKKVGADLDN